MKRIMIQLLVTLQHEVYASSTWDGGCSRRRIEREPEFCCCFGSRVSECYRIIRGILACIIGSSGPRDCIAHKICTCTATLDIHYPMPNIPWSQPWLCDQAVAELAESHPFGHQIVAETLPHGFTTSDLITQDDNHTVASTTVSVDTSS